jgi:hypothetical protein
MTIAQAPCAGKKPGWPECPVRGKGGWFSGSQFGTMAAHPFSSMKGGRMIPSKLAAAHGVFNLVFGAWPLLHYRSFEAVTGPKAEPWLVKTVGGLMISAGYAQTRSARTDDGLAAARRIGIGSAATFAAVDILTAGSGRISRIYLLDAVVELGWLAAWMASACLGRRGTGRRRS